MKLGANIWGIIPGSSEKSWSMIVDDVDVTVVCVVSMTVDVMVADVFSALDSHDINIKAKKDKRLTMNILLLVKLVFIPILLKYANQSFYFLTSGSKQ